MKCKKCKTDNINQANYCKRCGNKFTDEEKKEAHKWTFVWFLEGLENIKKACKLEFITDIPIIKYGSIVVILALGVLSYFYNGNDLHLLESENYKIQYNEREEEYYLLVNNEETILNVFVPNRSKNLTVKHYNSDGEIIEDAEYDKDDEIILKNDEETDYYVVAADYGKKSDELKLYVYRMEVEEN